MKELRLINPLHIELKDSGYGEFPDIYIVTKEGLDHIKKYLKENDNYEK